MPLLLQGIIENKELQKRLKKLGLKLKDIKSIYKANSASLIFLKDESLCDLYPEFIPDKETIKEIITVHKYVENSKNLLR